MTLYTWSVLVHYSFVVNPFSCVTNQSITSSGGSIILFPAKYTRFKLVHSSRYVPNLIVL